MEFEIEALGEEHREQVCELVKAEWGGLNIVSHGKVFYADKMAGFVVTSKGKVVGFALLNVDSCECEIVALFSSVEGHGIGTALITASKDFATKNKCKRLFLITTNDNIRAFEFYQKRGFVIADIRVDEIQNSRRLKPQIPLVAANGIPIRDEIEFEIKL